MGEPHRRHVVGELLGELAVVEEAVAFCGHAAPRPEVHLVDGHRRGVAGPAAALGHPVGVLPLVAVEAVDHRGGARGVGLEGEGEGIGLQRQRLARSGDDLVLVARALGHAGDEELPDAVAGMQAHRVAAAVPAVPVADHADPLGVGRPHREDHAVDLLDARGVGAELVVDAVVRALAEQVQVVAGERGGEPVGVLDLPDTAARIHHAEAIGVRHVLGHRRRPEARGVQGLHGVDAAVVPGGDDGHLARLGHEGADRRAALAVPVRAEHGEGIAVLTRRDRANDLRRELHPIIVPEARRLSPSGWSGSPPCSSCRDIRPPRCAP